MFDEGIGLRRIAKEHERLLKDISNYILYSYTLSVNHSREETAVVHFETSEQYQRHESPQLSRCLCQLD